MNQKYGNELNGLLESKRQAQEHNRQFAEFAKRAGGGRPASETQSQRDHNHIPDEQNRMRDQINLRK